MHRNHLLALILLFGCDGARTFPPPIHDGGATFEMDDASMPPVDAPPGACGEVTAEGQCDGDLLRYCDGGEVHTVDCAAYYPAPARGSCYVIAAFDGPICALSPGDPCAYTTSDGGSHIAPCAGEEAGCLWTASGAECREHVGTCGTTDQRFCNGEELVYGCNDIVGEGQPMLIDCADLGGACSGASCGDLPRDAECAEPILVCGEDLACEDGACAPDGPITARSCSESTMSGACTNTADCTIIDGTETSALFATAVACFEQPDVAACIEEMTGLSAACSACFTNPDPTAFMTCAGF